VYIPLTGLGGAVGLVEMHGLQTEGVTDPKSFERPIGTIKAMIDAKDYKFKDNLKLWRLPGSRSSAIVPADSKDYSQSNYQNVCGKVLTIATEKNGVPYFGGARYTIAWEDGLVEEALAQSDFLKVFVSTPQSLGSSSALSVELTDDLLKIGRFAGEVIEAQRLRDSLYNLNKKLNMPNLKDSDIFERSIDVIISIVCIMYIFILFIFKYLLYYIYA
jgi:hypothetical protein